MNTARPSSFGLVAIGYEPVAARRGRTARQNLRRKRRSERPCRAKLPPLRTQSHSHFGDWLCLKVESRFLSTGRIFTPPPRRWDSSSTTGASWQNSAIADRRKGLLLYRNTGRSGLSDPTFGRLARLQRVYGRYEASQGIHGFIGTSQDQGKNSRRTRGECNRARRPSRPDVFVFRRWRFPFSG